MELKLCFIVVMFLFLEGGILSNGKTLQPKYDSTSSSSNANSANNAISNSTVTRKARIMTTMEPSAKSIMKISGIDATKLPLLAQKLESSKGTPIINKTAADRSGNSREDDGLPLWAYIVIGVIGGALLVALVCLAYTKFIKWKDHGTYMVWDDAELETSPAFTRESEFLLETSTGGQEMVSPELQLYEIPLDSVTHPRIAYIGSKRVAPKRMDDKARKKDGDYVPSLTRYKKRDTVYNSVTDTCMTSVMSEGTLNGDGSISRHTLATVMLSNGGLDKYGSTSHHFDNTSTKGVPRDKGYSMDTRTRSVSNLIQSRPLPAVPINKRFSKSLDKLRFFNTLPVIKPTTHHKLPLPDPPPYATMGRSVSYGSNLQRAVNNNICIDPVQFAPRKSSLDLQINTSSPQKSTLSKHRKSKSLDTLTLLKEIDWNAINVDVYHSYESVPGTKSENGEYASVSDSQPSSPTVYSDSPSKKSPTKSTILTPPGNNNEQESIYASLSQENLHNITAINSENWNVNEGNEISYDSSTMSSLSSETTSPYATVRISQIPGLNYNHDKHEEIYSTKSPENSGGSLDIPEHSGSTVGEIKVAPNSARSSTHTYLELFPEDCNRDSIISETSSGYARPVDVIKNIEAVNNSNKEKDKKTSERQSLSNVQIPIETAVTFDDEKTGDPCSIVEAAESEAYDNPVKVSDDESQKHNVPKENKTTETEGGIQKTLPYRRGQSSHEFDEKKHEDVHVNEWQSRARSSSEHSECEI